MIGPESILHPKREFYLFHQNASTGRYRRGVYGQVDGMLQPAASNQPGKRAHIV